MSVPSTSTRPALGWCRPCTRLAIVVLPEPDGPTMPMISPLCDREIGVAQQVGAVVVRRQVDALQPDPAAERRHRRQRGRARSLPARPSARRGARRRSAPPAADARPTRSGASAAARAPPGDWRRPAPPTVSAPATISCTPTSTMASSARRCRLVEAQTVMLASWPARKLPASRALDPRLPALLDLGLEAERLDGRGVGHGLGQRRALGGQRLEDLVGQPPQRAMGQRRAPPPAAGSPARRPCPAAR